MSRLIKSIAFALVALALITPSAFADFVNFTKLELNGVGVGDTATAVKQVLGQPVRVTGDKGQFLIYGKGAAQLTIEMTADGNNVAFVKNGTTLTFDGAPVLKVGDPASKCDNALGGATHQVRQSAQGTSYVYKQLETSSVVVVMLRDNRVSGFILGRQ